MKSIILTPDQEQAVARLREYLHDPAERRAFLLEGPAGNGKTVVICYFLGLVAGALQSTLLIAPSNKAVAVLKRKLSRAGVPFIASSSLGLSKGQILTATTAQALGKQPVVGDDEDGERLTFGKVRKGLIESLKPSLIVVDEISMVGLSDFRLIKKLASEASREGLCKLIVAGDREQLEPVNERSIPFDNFTLRHKLTTPIRQASDSPILALATAVREGKDYADICGNGIRRVADIAQAYLNDVQLPAEEEEERAVYIPYTNAQVNYVQNLACAKLYGHDQLTFGVGEVVLSTVNLYHRDEPVVLNLDELRVLAVDPPDQIGRPCRLLRLCTGIEVRAHYLPGADRRNPHHYWVAELRRRRDVALERQKEWNRQNRPRPSQLDDDRCAAWRDFYKWKELVIDFQHPFSLTSHKAQGSTYGKVYADVLDLARYRKSALYVAVSRARKELVLPEAVNLY